MIPLFKTKVEIKIENQDEIINWIKDALVKEGVESFNKATIKFEGESQDDYALIYHIDEWSVKANKSGIVFRYGSDNTLHRAFGPAVLYPSDNNHWIVEHFWFGVRPNFPHPYKEYYFPDENRYRYNMKLSDGKIEIVISKSGELQYIHIGRSRISTIELYRDDIIKHLMLKFNLCLSELLLHPDPTIRKLAEMDSVPSQKTYR